MLCGQSKTKIRFTTCPRLTIAEAASAESDSFTERTTLLSGEHSHQLNQNDDAGNADDRHAAERTVACIAI